MSYKADTDPAMDLGRSHFDHKPIHLDISIVIPTLGRPILETSLAKILSGNAWPAALIVVDQGRNDSIRTWLDALRSRGIHTSYIPSHETGRSCGLNRGLDQVNTRFVAITDDDCFVEANWLTAMRARLLGEPFCVVSGRVESVGDQPNVSVSTSLEGRTYTKPRLFFDRLSGGNMGTSMEVVQKVGRFDEDPKLRTAEDGDWAYRALRAGVPLTYAPEVCLSHYAWRDARGRREQYRDYARSHGGFYGKYIRRGDLFIGLRAICHLCRCTKRWIIGLLRGDRECALHGKMYTLNLIPGILAGLKADSDTQLNPE